MSDNHFLQGLTGPSGESNKQTRALMDYIIRHDPNGIAVFDKELNFIYVSERFLSDYQLNNQHVIGKHHYEVFPEIPDKWKKVHQRVLQGEIIRNEEDIFIRVNGKVEYTRWECRPWRYFDDSIGGIIVYTELITDRKATENQLKISEEKFRKAFYTIPEAVTITRLDTGEYISLNDGFTRMLGYTTEEAIGKTSLELKIWPAAEERERFVQQIQQQNFLENYETSFRTRQGNIIDCLISVSKLDIDNIPHILSITRDVTEKKKLEDSTRRAYELVRNLAAQVPGVIYQYRLYPDGRSAFPFSSAGMYDIYEVTSEEVKEDASPVFTRIHPDDVDYIVESINESARNQTVYNSQFRVILPGKGLRWRQCNAMPERLDDGSTLWHGIITDITEKMIIQQELIQAKEKAEESNRLKTEFLNNMSHEIRTPMNGIIGFSELLDEPDITEAKRAYYAKIIQNSSKQLLRIIDDILEISTLETKQIRVVEAELCLNDLIMELFAAFNPRSKELNIPLYIKKGLHENESRIIADRSKLHRILANLLENALKFTNEGFIELGYDIRENNLILYVKDTGMGISPESHDLIFERFSQEDKEISYKHGGLGLGLSISKENARLMGGDITLSSVKGEGSTFFVTLPYKPVKKVEENPAGGFVEAAPSPQTERYTVLVAEDEEVNFLYLEVLFGTIKKNTYTLIHAKNGKEAVDICMENHDIDLVLMDIKMPVMNGHEATEKIKAVLPGLPVIALTAYSTEADREIALNHGCDDFVSKPLNREKFLALIHKHLHAWKTT